MPAFKRAALEQTTGPGHSHHHWPAAKESLAEQACITFSAAGRVPEGFDSRAYARQRAAGRILLNFNFKRVIFSHSLSGALV